MRLQDRQLAPRRLPHVRLLPVLRLVRGFGDVLLVVRNLKARVPPVEVLAAEARHDLQLPRLGWAGRVGDLGVERVGERLGLAQGLGVILDQRLRERADRRRLRLLQRELAARDLETVALDRSLQPVLVEAERGVGLGAVGRAEGAACAGG